MMLIDEIREAYNAGKEHGEEIWGIYHNDFEQTQFYKRWNNAEFDDLSGVLRALLKIQKLNDISKNREKWVKIFAFTEALDNKELEKLPNQQYWKKLNIELSKSF